MCALNLKICGGSGADQEFFTSHAVEAVGTMNCGCKRDEGRPEKETMLNMFSKQCRNSEWKFRAERKKITAGYQFLSTNSRLLNGVLSMTVT